MEMLCRLSYQGNLQNDTRGLLEEQFDGPSRCWSSHEVITGVAGEGFEPP